MSKTPPNLANLPPEVQALFAAQAAELGRKDAEMLGLSLSHATEQKRLKTEMASVDAALSAERSAHARAIQNRDTIIADLRLQLHGHNKHRFGSKSESSAQLALELILEEMEIEQAAETDDEDASSDAEATKPPRTPGKRKPFPKGLKRVQKTISPSDACTDCGGSFKVLGTDVMEELEYVPGHYIVNQIGRPRLACTCCEAVVQAEMSSRHIPKSFVGGRTAGPHPVLQIRVSPAALSPEPDVCQ